MEKSMMDANMYSSLNLAYIGDAVYELYVRMRLVANHKMPVAKFHKKTIMIVSAKGQAISIDAIMDKLTKEELAVYRSGQNAKSNTSSKNASIVDYHKATGFEALIGYLYLKGDTDRLEQIEELAVKAVEESHV